LSETKVEIGALEPSDPDHAESHKDHVEEKWGICEQAVDCEHGRDGEVVTLEVCEIPINSVLDIAKVCGFGETLQVKELADGLEIGESRGEGLCSDALKARAEIKAGG